MTRILVVTNIYPTPDSPARGTFVKNVCVGLEQDFDVEVEALSDSSSGRVINYILFYLKSLFKCIFFDYDIIYIHYSSHSSLGVLLSRLFKKNIIVTHVHGSDVLREKGVSKLKFHIKYLLSKAILKRSDLVVVPSEYYKFDVVVDKYSVEEERVYVSPSGGVDSNVFYSKRKTVQILESLNITYVGRLTEDKGIRDFLAVCKRLELEKIEYKAIVVGEGPLASEVCAAEDKFKLKFLGALPQDSLTKVYQNTSVFIFPTKRITESLGLVGLEAMACGVPVIAYSVGGPKTYIDHGNNGYLIDVGNFDNIYESLLYYHGLSNNIKKQIVSSCIATSMLYSSKRTADRLNERIRDLL